MQKSLVWPLCASITIHAGIVCVQFSSGRTLGRGVAGVDAPPLAVTLVGSSSTGARVSGSLNQSEAREAPEIADPVQGATLIESLNAAAIPPHYSSWLPSIPVTSENPAPQVVPKIAVEMTAYFLRSQLTIPPVLEDEPAIELPEAPEKGARVKVRLFISKTGQVDQVEVVDKAGTTDKLEEAAVEAVSIARFSPGERDGLKVGSQVVYEIDVDGLARGVSRSSDRGVWGGVVGGATQSSARSFGSSKGDTK